VVHGCIRLGGEIVVGGFAQGFGERNGRFARIYPRNGEGEVFQYVFTVFKRLKI
jgi:hypothetical protein